MSGPFFLIVACLSGGHLRRGHMGQSEGVGGSVDLHEAERW